MALIKGKFIEDGTITSLKLAAGIALTGSPTAPTAAPGTNTTQLATTAFVKAVGDLKVNVADKNVANGVAGLDANGKLSNAVVPQIAISDTFVVASEAAMLAVDAEVGDVAVRTDISKSFILSGTDPTDIADWQELLSPTDAVSSVNGQVGAVTLTTTEIAEGSNQYFTTARAKAATVADAIADGVTDVAPSQNAVFDALAVVVKSINGRTPTAGAVTLTSDHISEGSTNKYFTDARAKTAAVLNTLAGTETDQAPSVSSVKTELALYQKAIADAKESFTVDATILSNQYVDLAELVRPGSVELRPDGGPVQTEGVDYTLTTSGGVTRISFTGDLAALLDTGDVVRVQYSYLS